MENMVGINNITNRLTINGKKYIPLKDYKKPLAQLSQKAQEQISDWEKLLFKYEDNLKAALTEYYMPGIEISRKIFLNQNIETLIKEINNVNQSIREIKKTNYKHFLDSIA